MTLHSLEKRTRGLIPVLQCVAVCCCVFVCELVWKIRGRGVLEGSFLCCSVLQCVAVCCSELVRENKREGGYLRAHFSVAVCCSVLQ